MKTREKRFLGAQLTKESAEYLGHLRDETGIPVTHIFLMGLAKALPEIDPNFDLEQMPEIKKCLNSAHVWKALAKGEKENDQ